MTDTVNVPRDPTLGMLEAADRVGSQLAGSDFSSGFITAAVWAAMLDAAPKAEPVNDLPPISFDGPHKPNDHRVWLARQLLDSKNDDATAYGIAAFHPAISGLWKKSKMLKANNPAPSRDELLEEERELDASDYDSIDRSLKYVGTVFAMYDLHEALTETMARMHSGYDWNSDPDGITLKQGDAIRRYETLTAKHKGPQS